MSLRPVIRSLIFLSVAVACARTEPPPPVLRLGYSPHDHHAPLYVTATEGERFRDGTLPYLKPLSPKKEYELKAGDRVLARLKLVPSSGAKELAQKLSEDQLDAALGGFPAFVQQIDQGAPIRIIAPVMTGGSGLLVRSNFPGSTWKEFLDLARGAQVPLRIGHRGELSTQKLIFEEALARAGIPCGTGLDDRTSKVLLIDLYRSENLLPALKTTLVDGFLGVQPYLAMAEDEGLGKILSDLRDISCPAGDGTADVCDRDSPCCALAAQTAFGAAHPAAMEALVGLILRANRRIAERPSDAAAAAAAWLGTKPSVEQRSIAGIGFLSDLDGPWDEGARHWLQALTASGALRGQVARGLQTGTWRSVIYDRRAYDAARRGH